MRQVHRENGVSTLGEIASAAVRKTSSSDAMDILSANNADVLSNGVAEIELIDRIIIAAVRVWRIRLVDVYMRSKKREKCLPRFAIVLVAERAGYSMQEIATAMMQDRSTTHNAKSMAVDFMSRYPRFKINIEAMQKECGI